MSDGTNEQKFMSRIRSTRLEDLRLGLGSFLATEVLVALLVYLAEAGFKQEWGHYGGAIGSLPIGILIWALLKLYQKLKKIDNQVAMRIGGLESMLHRTHASMNQLTEQALSPLLVSSMVNKSPYTGALGSLYEKSAGKNSIEKIDKKSYLDLLREAIATTNDSYFTIQPPNGTEVGLKWFEDSGEFLEAFTKKEKKIGLCRILVMPDREAIDLELRDQGLVERYWQKVGHETDTYWITFGKLKELEKKYRRYREDGSSPEFTGIWEDTASRVEKSDIVVCDNRLCFRFEENARTNPQLAFFHDANANLFPYQWVLEALESDRSAKRLDRGHECQFIEVPLYDYSPSPLGPKYSKGIAIDLGHIEENTGLVQEQAVSVPIMAVLKGDAYGLGAKEISRTLMNCQTPVTKFGVSTTLEAADIKDVAKKEGRENVEIFLMEGVLSNDISFTVGERFTPFVWDFSTIQQINRQAERLGTTADIHIKINTGMNRLGVKSQKFKELLDEVVSLENVRVTGVASHLAHGQDLEDELTVHQLSEFETCVKYAETKLGPRGRAFIAHIASSASALQNTSVHYDMVRLGGALFGVIPGASAPLLGGYRLQSCVQVEGKVRQVIKVERGDFVSYGKTSFGESRGTIAWVNVGFRQGLSSSYGTVGVYTKAAASAGKAIVSGKLCPVVGVVCLGLVAVDISSVPGVSAGKRVVFCGEQGDVEINPEKVANWTDSALYKGYCDFGDGLPRRHNPTSEMRHPRRAH